MSGRVILTLAILAAAALAYGVPALGLRMLMPSLEGSPRARATNWRGKQVVLGLGVVWIFWVLALIAVYALLAGVDPLMSSSTPTELILLFAPLAILTLVVFAVGLVDDALGADAEKGFAGHFKALAHGRLTTGMLKMTLIGAASLLAAWFAANELSTSGDPISYWAYVLFGGMAIALTSNLVNLTDVRPGRALKTYGLLAFIGAAAQFATIVIVSIGAQAFGGQLLLMHGATMFVAVFLLLIGPALAAWPYDLGERGMLGDAGANPAGAVAGFVIVGSLPLSGVVVFAVLMLALNLASERWSFSAVIEKNRVLSWLDGLGRLPANIEDSSGGATGSGTDSLGG